MQNTGYGFCQCGCGQRTTVASRNYTARGYVKGEPTKFCQGHGGRRPLAERFWEKVDKSAPGGCWLWTAATKSHGYGFVAIAKVEGRSILRQAHRVAYELTHGPIPDGLEIDHLCRVRNCVNPAHLEAVTHSENCRRAAVAWARDKAKGNPRDTASPRCPRR
jgi:hypothetical protein